MRERWTARCVMISATAAGHFDAIWQQRVVDRHHHRSVVFRWGERDRLATGTRQRLSVGQSTDRNQGWREGRVGGRRGRGEELGHTNSLETALSLPVASSSSSSSSSLVDCPMAMVNVHYGWHHSCCYPIIGPLGWIEHFLQLVFNGGRGWAGRRTWDIWCAPPMELRSPAFAIQGVHVCCLVVERRDGQGGRGREREMENSSLCDAHLLRRFLSLSRLGDSAVAMMPMSLSLSLPFSSGDGPRIGPYVFPVRPMCPSRTLPDIGAPGLSDRLSASPSPPFATISPNSLSLRPLSPPPPRCLIRVFFCCFPQEDDEWHLSLVDARYVLGWGKARVRLKTAVGMRQFALCS